MSGIQDSNALDTQCFMARGKFRGPQCKFQVNHSTMFERLDTDGVNRLERREDSPDVMIIFRIYVAVFWGETNSQKQAVE